MCGTLAAILIAVLAVLFGHLSGLWLAALAGYLPAWVGHFLFEANTPASFRHPLYSLSGDFVMLFQTLTGRLRW